MAERISRMLAAARDLSAHVSHELRSPLARMRLAEELLRDELSQVQASGSSLARLDAIRAEIELVDQLVGRILQFSQLENRRTLAVGPLDLSALAEAVLDEFTVLARDRQLDWQKWQDKAEASSFSAQFIQGETELTRTVLRAAAENAIQHSVAGTSVSWRMERRSEAVILQIINDVKALPDDFESLFEPFRSGAGAGPGHGLGLAIVARGMSLLGGSARAFGEQGRFCLELRFLTAG